MIGQVTGNLLDLDIRDAGAVHDRFRGFTTCNVPARRYLHVLVVGAGHPDLRVHRENDDEHEQQKDNRLWKEGKSQNGGHGKMSG